MMIAVYILVALLLGVIDAGVILIAFPEGQLPTGVFVSVVTVVITISSLIFIAITQADVFRLKRRFGKQAHDLEERMAHTSEFVSIIAHQLRSPITAIIWALDALRKGDFGKLSAEQGSIVSRAETSATYLIDLTTNLLQLARLEQNRFTYAWSTINPTTLIQKVVERARLASLEKNITIKTEFPTQPLPHLEGDHEKLEIVIDNLVDNAIKYTPKGGTVTVAAHRGTLGLLLSVSDTGAGIPKETQEKIFQKFYRGPNARTVQGIGLGLYITKRIVEGHHGTIGVTCPPGRGSIFSVNLPLKQT